MGPDDEVTEEVEEAAEIEIEAVRPRAEAKNMSDPIYAVDSEIFDLPNMEIMLQSQFVEAFEEIRNADSSIANLHKNALLKMINVAFTIRYFSDESGISPSQIEWFTRWCEKNTSLRFPGFIEEYIMSGFIKPTQQFFQPKAETKGYYLSQYCSQHEFPWTGWTLQDSIPDISDYGNNLRHLKWRITYTEFYNRKSCEPSILPKSSSEDDYIRLYCHYLEDMTFNVRFLGRFSCPHIPLIEDGGANLNIDQLATLIYGLSYLNYAWIDHSVCLIPCFGNNATGIMLKIIGSENWKLNPEQYMDSIGHSMQNSIKECANKVRNQEHAISIIRNQYASVIDDHGGFQQFISSAFPGQPVEVIASHCLKYDFSQDEAKEDPKKTAAEMMAEA